MDTVGRNTGVGGGDGGGVVVDQEPKVTMCEGGGEGKTCDSDGQQNQQEDECKVSRNGSSPSLMTRKAKEIQSTGASDGADEAHRGGGLARRLDNCCRSFRRDVSPQVIVGMREVVCGTKLCLLFLVIPFTFIAVQMQLGRGWIFASSLIAIAPLAERLGYVTEQLAFFTGPTAGGLLNATFGNATEMIISIFALRKRMIRVVQLSLLGSILSNMLLVLGCAFFVGGLTHSKKDQKFNKQVAVVSTSLLLMACMGLLFPAVLHATGTELHNYTSELSLSRFISIVLVLAYGFYLFFQLKSHRRLYETEDGEAEEICEPEESVLTFWSSIIWLGILTFFISILSEYLVDAIQGAAEMWSIPVAFISVIILPLVGNAAEHGSAVVFAMKDKLDISLGVGIGSSTQISMFVIPFCVLVGWAFGIDMDLNFEIFETVTLFITVVVVTVMLQDGTANYFKGLMLILCYIMVGASFWVHVDNIPDHNSPGLGFAKHLIQKTFCMLHSSACQVVEPAVIAQV
ncbi:Ca2+:H+ antiporter [Marchantia polymorpha subsp. ruderalis]|uniref:Vacuolar cation/proton exchanger n=1 Tax=Marchantia polymorpha TaxID=3197 RepID=A0A2R6X8F3_MARPO|nr:hypothetical protein MARPO_0030s0113 [Marchantia polymorpha]BBN20267.1 hypothetical protein Mp_8g17790 [Marchantia polymorpha subsp. ruderalis]|eukprot:PTQ42386.1 hypothetical protein MARPO_0030s0113 [Marchantia polymorpha]